MPPTLCLPSRPLIFHSRHREGGLQGPVNSDCSGIIVPFRALASQSGAAYPAPFINSFPAFTVYKGVKWCSLSETRNGAPSILTKWNAVHWHKQRLLALLCSHTCPRVSGKASILCFLMLNTRPVSVLGVLRLGVSGVLSLAKQRSHTLCTLRALNPLTPLPHNRVGLYHRIARSCHDQG